MGVTYKKAAMAKARELLGKAELERLIFTEENYAEVTSRLEKVGRSTNLLYQSVPLQGDLNVLYQEDLDQPGFCPAAFELLYGSAPSPARLEMYKEYIQANQLPNRWTFPTFQPSPLFKQLAEKGNVFIRARGMSG